MWKRWEWVIFGWWLVGGSRDNTDQLFKITFCLRRPTSGLTNAFTGHECPPSPLLPPSSWGHTGTFHDKVPLLPLTSTMEMRGGRWWGGWKAGDRGGEHREGIGSATSAAGPSILKRQHRPGSVHLICGWPSVVIFCGDYWPDTLLSLTRFA